MTKIKAYFRLLKWKWAKPKPRVLWDLEEEEEITEFDLSPYLGWMEKEREHH
ncbi:MAG: hypothetical protein AB8G86_05015 [Saprospiraceae bacterium]